jgi:hypothetical protein
VTDTCLDDFYICLRRRYGLKAGTDRFDRTGNITFYDNLQDLPVFLALPIPPGPVTPARFPGLFMPRMLTGSHFFSIELFQGAGHFLLAKMPGYRLPFLVAATTLHVAPC